jgi:hypothetical protein
MDIYRDRHSREELPGKHALIRCRRTPDIVRFDKSSSRSSPLLRSSMKETCFVLVAEEEPDVSLEPPDSDQLAKMHPDSRKLSDHVPSKAEARISEGQLLCAGGAASPASVNPRESGLIIAIVAESVHLRRRHTGSAWNQCDDVLTWQANFPSR